MLETTPAKILVGLGNDDAQGALAYAAAEARRRGVGVHLLHAVPRMAAGLEPAMLVIEGDALCAEGGRVLAEAARHVEHEVGDLPVSTELHTGPVVPAITATSARAAVVVLQRRRMGHPGRIPTLSITNAVAAHAHVPVVAVPAGWAADRERDRTVVAGLGDVAVSAEVVRTALAEAARRGGRLRLVHAWGFSEGYDALVFAGPAGQAHEDHLRRELGAALSPLLAELPDVPVELVTSHTRAADALVAESATAGLLVLGRHRAVLPWGPHLGSVVRAVLRESVCPVEVVDPLRAEAA